MLTITEASYLDGYKLLVKFNNGKTMKVDLESELNDPVFIPLRNMETFKDFSIRFNTVEWKNGADFAPEFLFKIGELIN